MEPSYLHYSPLLPNPVLYIRDISTQLIRTLPRSFPSLNGSVLWLKESWEWQYTSFYFDSLQIYLMLLIAVCLALIQTFLNKTVFKNFAKLTSERNKLKFMECCWRVMFYSITSACCIYLCVISEDQFLFYPSGNLKNWVPGYPIKPTIYILHLFEAGYYILGLYTTFFLELYVKKKKDFLIQLFHHFVALLLIILSIGARFHEIGVLVLFLHDIGDVVLDTGRCLSYIEVKNERLRKVQQILCHTIFILFLLQWILLRLFWFPTKVLYLVACVLHVLICENYPFHTHCTGLIMILQLMHIYWFVRILKVASKALKGEGLKDSREKN